MLNIDDGSRARATAVHILIFVVGIALKLFLAAYLPLIILPFAIHDDALFLRLGLNIANGNWLGPYNELTLAKGPGYPLFLALSHLSGMPLPLTIALFQLFAIAAACWAVLRLTRSMNVACALFVVLIINPVAYLSDFSRILRDQIYWSQSVAVFSIFAVLFLAPPSRTLHALLLGVVAGLLLGWTWLSREEGIWFAPGLLLLFLGAAVLYRPSNWSLGGPFSTTPKARSNQTREFGPGARRSILMGAAAAVLSFGLVHVLFMTANAIAYHSFIGVDFKERRFEEALGILQSVEEGPRIPLVPVSLQARRKIAAVVPSYRTVEELLAPGGVLNGWERLGCTYFPHTCGEITGGYYMWALRQAVAWSGHYGSPSDASLAFAELGAELKQACADGRLSCRKDGIGYLPPMSDEQWKVGLPASILAAVQTVSFVQAPGDVASPASISPDNDVDDFYRFWGFLNYPITPAPFGPDGPKVDRRVKLSGWFFDTSGSDWPVWAALSQAGRVIPVAVERQDSPDLIAHFGPAASRSRFAMSFDCPDVCTLFAVRPGLESLAMKLERRAGARSVQAGSAIWLVDNVDQPEPIFLRHDSTTGWPFSAAIEIRTMLSNFGMMTVPVLLGAGFLAFLLSWLTGRWSPVLIFATAGWALVAGRIVILALIDVSSFPAARAYTYCAPASYIALITAVVSIWCLLWPPVPTRPA
ncbi:hypothetical protein OSH11_05955 [Kaistia dalseonensis]|uniref:Glycosyltransferase RgtA/B/C/D-like domain-containing protein n=1 Tax=Kaistia dalseonensis TaxID=410840 RepID=A0ABU0H5M4_9HYPH|nr:hypothetical protein [Kaistia dalseonensis]MCX5494234.1 hypothetical protein [Kaistia dalseonensis]MDQ0436814.1 hypothetical protein [Kaistia dalseonensis]